MTRSSLSSWVRGTGAALIMASGFMLTTGAASAFDDPAPVPDEPEATFYCNFFCGCAVTSDPGDKCTGGFCKEGKCTCAGWGIFLYCVE